jgi:hypothetical protein
MVLAHARALLTSTPEGATAYLDADLREPDKILAGAADLLEFRQPAAVLLIGILQLIPDADDPHAIVARLIQAVPPGSWLAVIPGRRRCVPRPRSPGSSTACNDWNLAWCRYTGDSPARPRLTMASRSPPMRGWPASPDRRRPATREPWLNPRRH